MSITSYEGGGRHGHLGIIMNNEEYFAIAVDVIRSFKDHLIAGLCSTDKSFPVHLWDRILPQAVITLNMLISSRINPKL
jgi:hypothetical protein